MTEDEPVHLPKTYPGIEDKVDPPTTWTNLPEGYAAPTVDAAATLEASIAEQVHTAALSIDHAARTGNSVATMTSAELNSEGLDARWLRHLVGCLAICLRHAHTEEH